MITLDKLFNSVEQTKPIERSRNVIATVGEYGEKTIDTIFSPFLTNNSAVIGGSVKELFRSLTMFKKTPEETVQDDFYKQRGVTKSLPVRKLVTYVFDNAASAYLWYYFGFPPWVGLFAQMSTVGRGTWDGLNIMKYSVGTLNKDVMRIIDRARAVTQLITTCWDNGTYIQLVYDLFRERKMPSYMSLYIEENKVNGKSISTKLRELKTDGFEHYLRVGRRFYSTLRSVV